MQYTNEGREDKNSHYLGKNVISKTATKHTNRKTKTKAVALMVITALLSRELWELTKLNYFSVHFWLLTCLISMLYDDLFIENEDFFCSQVLSSFVNVF